MKLIVEEIFLSRKEGSFRERRLFRWKEGFIIHLIILTVN